MKENFFAQGHQQFLVITETEHFWFYELALLGMVVSHCALKCIWQPQEGMFVRGVIAAVQGQAHYIAQETWGKGQSIHHCTVRC